MMKQMVMGAACALCVTVTMATPQMRWVPADADLVVVGASDPAGSKAVETIWETTAKAHGIDVDALKEESLVPFFMEIPELEGVITASVADSATAKVATYDGIVLSATLPANELDVNTLPAESLEGLAIYCFISNPKLNRNALTMAVKDLVTAEEDVAVKEQGEWTILTEKPNPDATATEEPLGILLAYRFMEDGVVWTLGFSDEVMKKVDAMLLGTAPTLPAKSPLKDAFTAEVAQTKTAAACFVLKNITELAQRYLPEEEYAAAIMEMPMLANIGAFVCTYTTDVQGTLHLTWKLDMGTAVNAEQVRDLALGWRAMMMGMLSEDPELSNLELTKIFSSIGISTERTWVKLTLSLTADQFFTAYKEFEEMNEAAEMEDCDIFEEEVEEIEMDEEEAADVLKAI